MRSRAMSYYGFGHVLAYSIDLSLRHFADVVIAKRVVFFEVLRRSRGMIRNIGRASNYRSGFNFLEAHNMT